MKRFNKNAGPDLANFRSQCLPLAQSIEPRATAQSCTCLETLFSKELTAQNWAHLTQMLDEQYFLVAAVSKIDLYKKVSACLTRP